MSSLRGKVMMGAVLWTVGLFAIITVVITMSAHAVRATYVIHAHAHLAGIVAVVCMAAGLARVRAALAPFDTIRGRLAAVRNGIDRQLLGSYPSEVQPLVDDLNGLLGHNEEMVRRANAKAGDLAHGLKTPLAVLSNESSRLAAQGQTELAAMLAQQVALMQRQVDYHLAQARAAASGAAVGVRCAVLPSVEGLARTLRRLHAERVAIAVTVSPDHAVRVRREDLDEMLGNLLDNACKWARTAVTVGSSLDGAWTLVLIDDDGPGLDPSMRVAVLQRGVRADEAAPGSGLGLAIVRELASLYGGSIALGSSPAGGLRAELRLPAA